MRWKGFVQIFVVTLLIPWVLCRVLENSELNEQHMQMQILETEPNSTETTEPGKEERVIEVICKNGDREEMPVETYVLGVVLGEMPASFQEEALKAQSVVARTYTMKRKGENTKHPSGAVCTDPGCCQAYCTPKDYLLSGHNREQLEKVTQAVASTKDQVLTYEGTLIDATYFSCSGGRTEAAVAVWGSDVPYLQSVESPGEESARVYTQTVIFDREALCDALDITLEGSPDTWFTDATFTVGGGVETLRVGGTVYTGTQLRTLLCLASTVFTVEPAQDAVAITTKGYGHRVGMSQYGAQAMANAGSSYAQILSHYYPGTVLENISE